MGLRPTNQNDTHLFAVSALHQLVADIAAIPQVCTDDITPFQKWLSSQNNGQRFNIACLFTIDASGRLRICLHPKMVRSKYEVSPLEEHDMTEGDVLSLVTLLPDDPNLLSITLQPLICSDALQLDTDHPQHLPIDAVNSQARTFPRSPPDHVDIVSVATCTPQPEMVSDAVPKYRVWHQQFREAFVHVASAASLQRHARATFVLANFWSIGDSISENVAGNTGGLSGIFVPMKLAHGNFPEYVQVSSYGRNTDIELDNGWSTPGQPIDAKRSTRAYLTQLNPYEGGAPEPKMLSFTIHRLPRHAQPWASVPGLRDISLRAGTIDHTTGHTTFIKRPATHG